jgi:hypothetical protein
MCIRRGMRHRSTSQLQATSTLVLPSVVTYEVCVLNNRLRHKLRTKFHENSYIICPVIKCAQTDSTGEVHAGFGWVRPD